jgi:hypothetical protein
LHTLAWRVSHARTDHSGRWGRAWYNPIANLKLKNVRSLIDFKRAGINLALGCDNCSRSDRQNIPVDEECDAGAGQRWRAGGHSCRDAIDAATIAALVPALNEIREEWLPPTWPIDLADFAYQAQQRGAPDGLFGTDARACGDVDGEIVQYRAADQSNRICAELMNYEGGHRFQRAEQRQAPAIQKHEANRRLTHRSWSTSPVATSSGVGLARGVSLRIASIACSNCSANFADATGDCGRSTGRA